MKLIHLAKAAVSPRLFNPDFCTALKRLGDLTIIEQAGEWEEAKILALIRDYDVILSGWGGIKIPDALVDAPGKIQYICHLTGTLDGYASGKIIASDILVTNWGEAPAAAVAEGALALLLACLKNLPAYFRDSHGRHPLDGREYAVWNGSMHNIRLGLYGFGVIGREFFNLCRPFNPRASVYDPYVTEIPAGVTISPTLAELFATSDAVVIHAALTSVTRKSVTTDMLARLPDGGIIINTARGDIIDQAALFQELKKGRLRAGLDVLSEQDPAVTQGHLAADDPARGWPNLIVTPHVIERSDWAPAEGENRLERFHVVALENLKRFQRSESLLNLMTPQRFSIST